MKDGKSDYCKRLLLYDIINLVLIGNKITSKRNPYHRFSHTSSILLVLSIIQCYCTVPKTLPCNVIVYSELGTSLWFFLASQLNRDKHKILVFVPFQNSLLGLVFLLVPNSEYTMTLQV